MKQKIVIKVCMNDQPSQSLMACFSGPNSRSRALQIAVGLPGVEQAALGGNEDQIEVTGDGIDAVELTNLLRKKVGSANIISVTPVEAKKEVKKEVKKEEKKEEPKVTPPMVWTYAMPQCHCDHDPCACSIM